MWLHHPFSQRKERAVEVSVEGDWEGRGLDKILKREVGNIGGLGPLCQLCI